jgi:hypothetical protein
MNRRSDDPSPLALALGVVVLLGALVALAWFFHFLGWGLHADSVEREGHVNRQSYGYQQAQRERLSSLIADVNSETTQMAGSIPDEQRQALGAQRWHTVGDACATAAQINELGADQSAWVAANCTAGAGNPRSEYAPTAS